LKSLQSAFGHTNCGVFAEIVQTGTVQTNDVIKII